MVDWPTTLPGFLSGISDKKGKTKIRSSVDVGPAIQRKRYTAAVRNINVPMKMSNAERIIFEEFYTTDLDEGVLSFVWIDPLHDTSVTLRFRSEEAPEWQGSGAKDDDPDKDVRVWQTTFELEIMP